jgi:thioesterase DpgC
MTMQMQQQTATLANAGLAPEAAKIWLESAPAIGGDFARDARAFAAFWLDGAELRAGLPDKAHRDAAQSEAARLIFETERAARERFLTAHVETVYRKLTHDYRDFVRAETLVYDAARSFPGLTPTQETVARDDAKTLGAKEGYEIDQGIFLAHVLAHPAASRHLLHAMMLPRPETAERLEHFLRHGEIDLGAARVLRMGKAAVVEMHNPRFLNAMDDTTGDPVEIATDIAILDPETMIAVLRGGVVENPKYAGRRLFSAGINLTRLYQGQISYLFYIRHILGFENKWLRGLARPDFPPDERVGQTIEKPWIAALDGFAIGGGCQHLLVMDYILAAADAYMTLPARKEGIIPGASNMRLPRFTGDRIARQAVMYERRLDCDSAEGRLICDEIAAPKEMDAALARVVDGLTSSGVVSAVANRRAFRVQQEPIDLFLNYVSVYAREQAYCHFSPALIANLERHWNAQNRKA